MLLILALSIFIIEFAVMMALYYTALHELLALKYWEETLLNSTAPLMFFSILYFLAFKALVKQEKKFKGEDKIIATYDFVFSASK